MKTIRDVMSHPAIWVNPDHTIKTAIILFKGHDIGGLPVLKGDDLVGFLEYQQVLGVPEETLVGDVMLTELTTSHPDMPLKQVAEMLSKTNIHRLAVLENHRLVGIVSASDLLLELGRSYDPLTQLPWADTLREWSIDALASGREITIIFFDLDRFGMFNKRFGHLTGDHVLQKVAQVIKEAADTSQDMVCRYGGDEFAITTIRRSDEAALMASRISRDISMIHLASVDISVSATYGYFGGKRTREREHVHYAATIDNLINLASKECMSMKINAENEQEYLLQEPVRSRPKVEPPKPLSQSSPIELLALTYVTEDIAATASIQIKSGAQTYASSLSGPPRPEQALELVAQVTASALLKILPRDHTLLIEQVIQQIGAGQRPLVTVVAVYVTPEERKSLVGSAFVEEDIHRATALALISAVSAGIGKVGGDNN
ncbi:MAG: GGDEF domain-containing protein [bacterium]